MHHSYLHLECLIINECRVIIFLVSGEKGQENTKKRQNIIDIQSNKKVSTEGCKSHSIFECGTCKKF
jgi:hypothetical protein